jgi:hypothetical protein
MAKFIDFSDGKALMVNNADWLLPLNYIEMLRDVGTHFYVNRMLTAECYKQRMANGLSFLESSLLTASGSLVWELFCETETPSINDLVTTTLGGTALGEMFHRLYVIAAQRDFLFAPLLSPTDAINRTNSSTGAEDDSHYSLLTDFSLAAGITTAKAQLDQQRGDDDFNSGVSGNLELRLAYGDPFGMRTNVPYKHFEQRFRIDFSPSFYSFVFFSDGFLASWAPFDDDERRMSVGPTLHYDLIYSSSINFQANAIGLSMKDERRLPNGFRLRTKIHANWVVLGASDHIYLSYGDIASSDAGQRNYDFGVGASVKLSAALYHRKLGEFAVDHAGYGQYSIPDSVTEIGSEGFSSIGITTAAYERKISSGIYTGLSLITYNKRGRYRNAPDVDDSTTLLSAYIRKRL